MEILKAATDWAEAEVFSAKFFILFSIMFLLATVGFWQLGKTETARAYIIPTLVAGALLMAVGLGIFFTNKSRVTSFAEDYQAKPTEFVKTEISRTAKSIGEFRMIVFKVIPFIIVAAALLIFFVDKANWRASAITTIALMVVILFVDSNANARIKDYKEKLELAAKP